MIVYMAINKENGKKYIGKTIRTLSHAKSRHHDRSKNGLNTRFYNAIRKYGFHSFTWKILYTGKSDEDICEKEKFFIKKFKTKDSKYGYNMTDGGDGLSGFSASEETRLKLSKLSSGENNPCYGLYGKDHPAYGNKYSDEVKKKISNRFKNIPKTKEHKEKLRKSRLDSSEYSYEIRLKMIKLREDGFTYRKIAEMLNIKHAATVFKIVKNFKKQYATVGK